MKIIITGSAGFIGYHLSKKLLEKNISVVGIDSINSYYDTRLKEARLLELKNITLNFDKLFANFNKIIS